MKILIGLSVLQTIAIVVLIAMLANKQAEPQVQSAGMTTALHNDQALPSDPPRSFDEERLRSIIREELATRPAAARAADAAKPIELDPQAAAKMRDRRELVAQKIESYKGIGAITDSQMQELQDDMAQLDDPSRKQMMSSLIRAMNAGTIKGRL